MTLKQIRERWEKATKGPSKAEHFYAGCGVDGINTSRDDAEFIAHSWSDIEKLLKVAEAAKAYMSDDGFVNVLYYHAFEALRQALKELEGE